METITNTDTTESPVKCFLHRDHLELKALRTVGGQCPFQVCQDELPLKLVFTGGPDITQ